MTAPTPLLGTELIDCARANSKDGIEAASHRCGYGENLSDFERELSNACHAIGVKADSFAELIAIQPTDSSGIEIAPESASQI
jgi:hypothetical protein